MRLACALVVLALCAAEHVQVRKLEDAAIEGGGAWNAASALARHKRHKRGVLRREHAATGGRQGAGTTSLLSGAAAKLPGGPGLRWLSPLTRAWLGKLRAQMGKLRPMGEGYPFLKLADRMWARYAEITHDFMTRMQKVEQSVEALPVRTDSSMFLSVASYRDRHGLDDNDANPRIPHAKLGMCSNSIVSAYKFAKHPERLFVGIVDQACRGIGEKCWTGVYRQSICKQSVLPDRDCAAEACAHPAVAKYCARGQVRGVELQENDAMGPMVARWIASQLWRGENYFLQIDAHSVFGDAWDDRMIADLRAAPNPKAIISTYPPDDKVGDEDRFFQHTPGTRICGSMFSKTDDNIIRLEAGQAWESAAPTKPKNACFVAAGFFVANSAFLKDSPYDPYLPWAFMGEEILQSARVWTKGWDIYSPTQNAIAHQYTVDGVPRFWETLNRMYGAPGIHNSVAPLALRRIMHILGWPDYKTAGQVHPKSMLFEINHYGIDLQAAADRKRPLQSYMLMSGIHIKEQRTETPAWCTGGTVPANCRGADGICH